MSEQAGETWHKVRYSNPDRLPNAFRIRAPLWHGGNRIIADKLTEADADRILADHALAARAGELRRELGLAWREIHIYAGHRNPQDWSECKEGFCPVRRAALRAGESDAMEERNNG